MIFYSFWSPIVQREVGSVLERGDHVDLICLQGEDKNEFVCPSNLHVYKIQKRKFDEKGPLTYLSKLLRFFLRSAFMVSKFHLRKKYDIIQVISPPNFLVFATLIPKLLGAKVILDMHDPVPEFYACKFNLDTDHIIIKALKLIERLSVIFSDHVIVVTHLWKDILASRSVPRSKSTVILNMPDPNIFASRKDTVESASQDFVLIYPGLLAEHTGVDVAIKAVHIASRAIPSIRFEIYGYGRTYKTMLIELVRHLKLDKIVRFHEHRPTEEIARIISRADVGIDPKQDGVYAGQTLSLKLLEFLSVGVPAIASKTETTEAYFDNSMVMFFEPGNEVDLARCIVELYNHPERRQELVRNAFRFNEDHNWERYKRIYWQLLDSLCSR